MATATYTSVIAFTGSMADDDGSVSWRLYDHGSDGSDGTELFRGGNVSVESLSAQHYWQIAASQLVLQITERTGNTGITDELAIRQLKGALNNADDSTNGKKLWIELFDGGAANADSISDRIPLVATSWNIAAS